MSDIKRYAVKHRFGVQAVVAHAEGEYVLYEDHLAAMEALKWPRVPTYHSESNQSQHDDHEGRIKALEENPLENHMALIGEPKTLLMHKPVGVLLQALVDPLKKRLEALEKALNEHMVKERDSRTVELSDIDLLRIIIQRKSALIKVQKYERASWFRDVERALVKACGIPEGAIEGMSANPSKEP